MQICNSNSVESYVRPNQRQINEFVSVAFEVDLIVKHIEFPVLLHPCPAIHAWIWQYLTSACLSIIGIIYFSLPKPIQLGYLQP
ncbi:ABC transporter BEA3 [Fusarium oxysporum f. sp. albedinis]|nr:ABC transporter BEA3 [Fusarium oxysporum f. sp. albedinis]